MRLKSLLSLVCASLGTCLSADNTFPVSLEGPEVLKLDWSTRSLVHGDLNDDGLVDLALINNDRGSVELLFRRADGEPPAALSRRVRHSRWVPVLDNAAYDRRSVVTGQNAYALQVGDFNGDGRMDLAFTGNRVPLTLLFQDETGAFSTRFESRAFEPQQWPASLRAVDLNGDGRMDLIALSNDQILVFYQEEDGTMRDPVSYRLASADSGGLRLEDVDGDGRLDIVYVLGSGSDRHLVVRLQSVDGGFGPEYLFPMEIAHGSHTFLDDGEAHPLLVYAEQRTGVIRTARLAAAEAGNVHLRNVQARSYTLPSRLRDPGLFAVGDFSGAGDLGIVAADPARAEVLHFMLGAGGDFEEGVPFPSFASLSALTAYAHPDLAQDLLVAASADERLVGFSAFSQEGRFAFPQLIPVEGRPLLLATGTFTNAAHPDLIVLEKRGRDFFLTFATPSSVEPLTWTTRSVQLENQARDPRAMYIIAVDGQHPHLVLLGQREPLRLFRWLDDVPVEVAVSSNLRQSLLGDVEPRHLTFLTPEEGQPPAALLAGQGFVRILRYADEDFVIEDQFNARSGSTRLALPHSAPEKEYPGFLVFAEKENELHLHRRDESNVLRFVDSVPLPPIEPLGARFAQLQKDGPESLVIFGTERFLVLPFNRQAWVFEDVHEPYETDLEPMNYMAFEYGDFTGDGSAELVAVDAQNNVLEILGLPDGEQSWSSYLHFTLFDQNVNMGPRRGVGGFQPREGIVTDLNGDGLPDIAFLIHDRLLIYTQSPR